MVSAPLTRGAPATPKARRGCACGSGCCASARSSSANCASGCKSEFDTTLPRFDVMAALDRKPDGLTMSELSRCLLVSNGNVTGIVDRLVAEGHAVRAAARRRSPHLGRALTAKGREPFAGMAAAHEGWIDELLGRRLSARGRASSRRCWKPSAANWEERDMTRMAGFEPEHFLWRCEGEVARHPLDRPERKNPLTFESYAELRDCFRALRLRRGRRRRRADRRRRQLLLGRRRARHHRPAGRHGHDRAARLHAHDRRPRQGDARLRQPIIAAVDGVCVGAGAILAMASDIRLATPEAKTAFLFTRVGLAGCDMGACAMLPRIIGQGRAAELLYTGRTMTAQEGERWGFYNRLVDARRRSRTEARRWRASSPPGPTFAHGITKTQLNQEWSMGLDQAIEAEAQAQAICMQTRGLRARLPRLRRQGAAGLRGRLMADRSFLDWPFFEERHRDARRRLDEWCRLE